MKRSDVEDWLGFGPPNKRAIEIAVRLLDLDYAARELLDSAGGSKAWFDAAAKVRALLLERDE